MSVIKIEKTKDYTVMSNYHFREKNMSLKAKGLLSLMLSLPEDWDYSIAGLVAICKENETSIKTALDELKKFKYLEVVKKLPDKTTTGRIEYEYIVYEQKIPEINTKNIEVKVGKELIQELEKQGIENLGVEFLGLENQGQLNTNKSITKKLNTNNEERKKETRYDIILNEKITDNRLRDTFYEFLKMRKLIKKPMTDKALILIINKLNKIANSTTEAVNILERSIINNWQDIYPLEEIKGKNWVNEMNNLNDIIMAMDV